MSRDSRTRWIRGISLAALLVFGPGLVEFIRLSLEQRRMDRRLAALKAEHERLSALEQRLRTDPTYVEGLIRSTFKVAQPGEYVIPMDEVASTRRR